MMLKRLDDDLQTLYDFLQIKTPEAWLQHAIKNIPTLLIDHAHCERKAAATAIHFMSKHPEKIDIVAAMSPLAREELLHFEKVTWLMQIRGIHFEPLHPSDYASRMHKQVTARDGHERLSDQLVIGAIIEARSCERFGALVDLLDDQELAKFYASLLKSEARHFQSYLRLARNYCGSIESKVARFLKIENEFIVSEDEVFRFHSGVPGPHCIS